MDLVSKTLRWQEAVFGDQQPLFYFGPRWWNWRFSLRELRCGILDRVEEACLAFLRRFNRSYHHGLYLPVQDVEDNLEAVLAGLLVEAVLEQTGQAVHDLTPLQRIRLGNLIRPAIHDILTDNVSIPQTSVF